MKARVGLIVFALALLVSTSGWAATIQVNTVTGQWQNSVPVAGITINNTLGTKTVRWGVSTGEGQSGYNFTSLVPPPAIVTVPPSSSWLPFGIFAHVNEPIMGTTLTSVQLGLDLSMLVAGSSVNQSFLYTFNHEETPNSGTCAYPGGPACADRVTISAPSAGVFTVNDVEYTLELAFSTDGGLTAKNEFITYEDATNTASIFGRFTSENIPSVPEPGILLLLGFGLSGTGFVARRRMKK